jgi:hypothetical protein
MVTAGAAAVPWAADVRGVAAAAPSVAAAMVTAASVTAAKARAP